MANTVKKVTTVKREIVKTSYPKFRTDNLEEEFSIDNDVPDVDIEVSAGKIGKFKFYLEQLPHCCGSFEIGGIVCTSILTPAIINKCLNITAESAFEGKECYTLIINTNGKGSSIPLEAALKVNKYFTLVKTFVNRNSGSTIKMWVSNN